MNLVLLATDPVLPFDSHTSQSQFLFFFCFLYFLFLGEASFDLIELTLKGFELGDCCELIQGKAV